MSDESCEHRDKRIKDLWLKLDTRAQGEIDLDGLRKGLHKIDHPLKNADVLLGDVLKAVDTSGDGRIQFAEFKAFVEHAEKELWQLFQTIDRDHNGALDKEELRSAFRHAGMAVSRSKLDQFFDEVDSDHDGEISFEEWRNFLLFIPHDGASLRAVISYYTATGNVNSEGDVHINNSLQGVDEDEAEAAYEYDDEDEDEDSQDHASLMGFFPPLGYFIAGGLAGMISRTATAPLDRLKVYLIAQTSPTEAASKAAKDGAPVEAVKRMGGTLIDACRDLWRAGGMRSLFAGNGLNVVKVMPESAIKFGAYEASKRFFARIEGSDPRHLHPTSQFLAGGMGGVISQCVVYPLDTLKFRMQCETVQGGLHGNALIAQTAKKMWAQGGFTPYYRGLLMGLAGMFPYSAIDLFIFENCKTFVLARKASAQGCHETDVEMGNVTTAAIGASSGAISASVVYPINVLRTRLQAQGTVLHKPTYTGIVDVTRKTIQNEGFRGLFRGVTPNLLKVAPAVSISYVVYENSKALLDQMETRMKPLRVVELEAIRERPKRTLKVMFFRCIGALCLLHLALQATGLSIGGKPKDIIRQNTKTSLQNIVTWDADSLFVRGERVIFYSGEFHPFRLPVTDLWLDVFQKVKSLGYNGVSFYTDWALLEGTEGTFTADGIFALEPFFDAASEAGIYLLARPGPYINAEVSGGGFPGWLGRINGTLRTNATDFLSATDLYIQSVGKIIAKAQITNGGPIILYQVENEYTYPANNIVFPNIDYYDYVLNQALSLGLTVPIINNDAGPLGYFAPGNSTFGNVTVDIYGHDSYPLGFDCSNPYNWPDNNLPTNFRTLHEQQAPDTPYSIIEFQGGSFDPWGGPGFGKCGTLVSEQFERVFYKNNWGSAVTIYNQYMIYGGTNWGNLGHPGGYTSYDYAAVIAEDRSIAREKYSEAKLEANFLKVSPSYLASIPAKSTNGSYTDTTAIRVTPLLGNGTSTNLYIVRHSAYNSNDSISYRFNVHTSIGNVTIPQLDTYASSLTLSARDSKVHVTDYDVGGHNLIYSTAEIFTWQKYDDKSILILYGGQEETHEFALPSSLGSHTVDGTNVATKSIDNYVVFQWQVTPQQQVITFNSLTVYILWRNDAYNWWTLELPAVAPISNFSLPSKTSVIVKGGYLLRTAEILNNNLYLTGDVNSTTTFEVIGAPPYQNLFFNSEQLGTTSGEIVYKNPQITLPDLAKATWKSIDTLPELSDSYGDLLWTTANKTNTNNPLKLTTPTVLYASEYGYHTGPLLYRGHFSTPSSSLANTTLSLTTQGGYAYGYQVYLNDRLIYSYPGFSTRQNHTASIQLPTLDSSKDYVLTAVIDHTGLNENFNPGDDTMKQPRGILSYNLTTLPQSAVTWKVTGNLDGENYIDKTRGPLNEGGFHFERQGYHLPGAPTNGTAWTEVIGGPVTGFVSANGGARFYSTVFALDIPADSYDLPLAFQFTNTSMPGNGSGPSHIRSNLYVNGYQFGKYVNDIGPQTLFPVPEGILNYNGENTVGVYLWNLNTQSEANEIKLAGLELVASSTPLFMGQGKRRKISPSPQDSWVKRDLSY